MRGGALVVALDVVFFFEAFDPAGVEAVAFGGGELFFDGFADFGEGLVGGVAAGVYFEDEEAAFVFYDGAVLADGELGEGGAEGGVDVFELEPGEGSALVGAGAFGVFCCEGVEVFTGLEALEDAVGGGLFELAFLGGVAVVKE